jgi:hypothetical protein
MPDLREIHRGLVLVLVVVVLCLEHVDHEEVCDWVCITDNGRRQRESDEY